jgi:hypothetical protein
MWPGEEVISGKSGLGLAASGGMRLFACHRNAVGKSVCAGWHGQDFRLDTSGRQINLAGIIGKQFLRL